MLLNCFAQPTLLSQDKVYFDFEEFKESPMLVCNKNALDGKFILSDWSGHMFATENILNQIKDNNYNIKPSRTHVLNPNEIYNIRLNDDLSQCKVKDIELIAIPCDENNLMYFIKADNVASLLTDMVTNNMEVFVQNKVLRNVIKTGIDVLYVNDGVYNKSEQLKSYPSECLLGALVSLVQPRFVQGLSGEEQLPQHILNCCANR